MSLGRFLQLLGLVIVTVVMFRSYQVSDMAFQFGGLAVGALVFVVGHTLDRREEG